MMRANMADEKMVASMQGTIEVCGKRKPPPHDLHSLCDNAAT
jgi:hypothetical protein